MFWHPTGEGGLYVDFNYHRPDQGVITLSALRQKQVLGPTLTLNDSLALKYFLLK